VDIKAWVLKNITKIIIVLVVANFVIMIWGAINWGAYSLRNSTSLFRLDDSRNKKLLLQDPNAGAIRTPTTLGQSQAVLASSNLTLVCSDDDVSSAFASVRPAVVNITADKVTTQRRGGNLASAVVFDDPAIQFVEEQSLGSGIIIDARGFIVTNAHVVNTARSIKIITFGFERTAYPAEVIRKDAENDIAILRIYPEAPLPVAILGDSDMIKVAETVLAVGSPFGLEQTVTAGIISDDSRDLIIDGQTYEQMIQTDAAINRGNSGGPLINVKGEVIGINTAIYAPTGVFTGIGFAIPVNKVVPVIKEILAKRGV